MEAEGAFFILKKAETARNFEKMRLPAFWRRQSLPESQKKKLPLQDGLKSIFASYFYRERFYI